MIWIIGGTSEARELVHKIKDLQDYIVSVATEEGRKFLSIDNVVVGRMDYDEMKSFSLANNISVIVDLSHPYAKLVSFNAKALAKNLGIKYIRYLREKTIKSFKALYFESYEQACNYISKIKATVFFTTGSNRISDFEKVKGENRFIHRVLPALESIRKCEEANISIKDIVAVLGPFSREYNKIMFSEYKADYVVMKDSGVKGGTIEKIEACQELDIIPLIISRQEEEEGISSLDRIEEIIRKEIV